MIKINSQKEIKLSIYLLCISLFLIVMATEDLMNIMITQVNIGATDSIIDQSIFIIIVFFLIYGNLIYQITRLAYYFRMKNFKPAPIDAMRKSLQECKEGLTILVPSYKEEPGVVSQTLLSAILMPSPKRRVVLLVDNPPDPVDIEDQELLSQTLSEIGFLKKLVNDEAVKHRKKHSEFNIRSQKGKVNFQKETITLADHYNEIADWYAALADTYNAITHTDKLFLQKVLFEPSQLYREYSDKLINRVQQQDYLNSGELVSEYEYLTDLFTVDIEHFERKRYVNLSHEPNKAMNINSYLGLMGGHYAVETHGTDSILVKTTAENASLHIPDAEFVITLDADSIISHDYTMKLLNVLMQDGNERIAVIQTPYNAMPNAPGIMERVAGATTDIQYNIHQGFTYFNATYWVGANALIRVSALQDIKSTYLERGFEIHKFIQDRTVIEDTESSIDLIERKWTLFNYSEKLAYSATPHDFGSLLIQRRRWANGGLIILPKLIKYLCARPWNLKKITEGIVRVHYLISIAAINIGLLFMFIFSFDENMNAVWLPMTALPYFFLYGRDLVLGGYKWMDLFRIYALNLMLIPINLGGVFKSIEQGITGRQIPFGRTPKVIGHTPAPVGYILAVYALTFLCIGRAVEDVLQQTWLHFIFICINGGFFIYAIFSLMIWKHSLQDINAGIKGRKIKVTTFNTQWRERKHPRLNDKDEII